MTTRTRIIGFLRKNIKAYFKHIVARRALLPMGVHVRSEYTMSIPWNTIGVPQIQHIASAGFGNNLVIGIVRSRKMGWVVIKCVPASLIGYGTGKIGAKIAHRVAVEIFGKQCLPLHRSKTNTHYETCKILFHHLCFFVNKNGCGCFYQEALFYFLTSFLTATPSVVRK